MTIYLALPIFEHMFILFFSAKLIFLLETVSTIPVYVSEQTFLFFVTEKKRCTYVHLRLFFWTHFVLFRSPRLGLF